MWHRFAPERRPSTPGRCTFVGTTAQGEQLRAEPSFVEEASLRAGRVVKYGPAQCWRWTIKIYQMKARGVDDTPYLFATVHGDAGKKLMTSYFEASLRQDRSVLNNVNVPEIFFVPDYSTGSSNQLPDVDELMGNDGLVLSSEALHILEGLLKTSGELIRFSNRDDYRLYYCNNFLDPFVKEETYVTKGFSTLVKIHSFNPQSVAGSDFFKTIYDPRQCYVSENFKEIIEATGLRSNLMFPLVWDSDDPDFLDETWNATQWARIKADPELTFQRLDRI